MKSRPGLSFVLFCLMPCGALTARIDAWLDKPAAWYASEEAQQIADNVLAWQSAQGSWPKNTDTSKPYHRSKPESGTFDNGASRDELRFLARMIANGKGTTTRYKKAFLEGLEHILNAQYDNGGWPQRHPPGKGYLRHITFNDGTMVGLLELLREIGEDERYNFLNAKQRSRVKESFERGVACILACQIVKNGRRTVWCAQHDEKDFRPRGARAYELPSFSGSESAGILKFLMRLPDPTPEIIEAVEAGVQWFEEAKLTGIRLVRKGDDREIIEDPEAPALWARFYDLESGKPFFAGRDGVAKSSLAEIEAERRNGYAWYGSWGDSVAKAHKKWRQKWRERIEDR